jgi:hypothetical protein
MMLKVLLPPIVVPIIAYGFMYSETIWKQDIQYLGGTRYLPVDSEEEKKEMEKWSSDKKLRINDPDYNPFAPKLRR